jgi:hypothetical protein
MPLVAMGLLFALVLWVFYKSYVSSLRRDTYIEINAGAAYVRRGWARPQAVAAVADILRGARVSDGYIAISADNKVTISWHIPPALHQQLRNVLLCDRAVEMPRHMAR